MTSNSYKKRAYSVREFRELFGISNTTFYKLLQAGEIRVFKIGRKTLIDSQEAERWYQSILR